jgi:hypothetical protein
MLKERYVEKKEDKPIEKKEEQKPLTPPRKLAHVNLKSFFFFVNIC